VKPGEQWQIPFCRVSKSGQDWVDGGELGDDSLDGDWFGADPLDAGGASLDGSAKTQAVPLL
jgi:hypothetical protein